MIALRSPARFIGAMGSRRAQEPSAASGCSRSASTDEELARLSAPIGLDLGALSAEETALSILARSWPTATGATGGGSPTPRAASTRSPPRFDDRRTAARRGRRVAFGGADSKLLAELEGTPAARARRRAPRATCRALERVVVVLGCARRRDPRRGRLRRRGAGRLRGLGERDRRRRCAAGLQALGDASTVIVTLGDPPLLTSRVIALFVREPGGDARGAHYDGEPGHPVVLESRADRSGDVL